MPLPIKITLKAARVNASLTQEMVAKTMGVTRTTVNAWETGRVRIGKPQLQMFCNICAIPEDNIFLPNGLQKVERK